MKILDVDFIYIYIHDYIHTGTQFHRLHDVHSDAHSTLVFFCPFTVPCWTNICGTCWHKTYWTKLRLELLRLFRSMISWKWIRIVCDHFQNLADNPNGDVADAPLADLKHLEASRSIVKHWAAGPCHFCTALAEVQDSWLLLLLNLRSR